MSSAGRWSLDSDLRTGVVLRAGANLFSLAFQAKKDLPESDASQTAERLEQEAYVAAQAQSSMTTGARPLAETTKIYIRKLAELVIEFIKNFTSTATSHGRDKQAAEVILSTKSFGLEAAEVAGGALQNIKASLHTANLSDIIGGRAEQEALQVLEKLSEALACATLSHLDLSDNALGEKGLRACQKLFTAQPRLHSLSLRNIGCSPNACLALKELAKGMKLKGLFLYNNMSGDEGGKTVGEMLADMPSMEQFQMASSRVGAEGVLDLTAGLSSATALLSLDLNDNPATEESVPGIVELIQGQDKLKKLNLSDTSLGDKGITQLATALSTAAPHLEVLELALNEITFVGAKTLSLAIAAKKELWKLDLHENELEDRGGLLIAKAISASNQLKELNMSENMLHRVGAVAIAKSLKGKQEFQSLLLDENLISSEGLEEMKALLSPVASSFSFSASQDALTDIFGNSSMLGSLEENEEETDEEEELQQINLDLTTNLQDLIQQLTSLSLHS